jgi:hypothetical protein
MRTHRLAIIGICGLCAAVYAADTIAVQHSRPLGALALELQKRYGYPVTYEDSPFDPAKLRTQFFADGTSSLNVPVSSVEFQMPDVIVGEPVPGMRSRVPAGLPDVLQRVVAGYHRADGATFSVLPEGGYLHIVPVNRVVNGKEEPFQPVLGTTVTVNAQGSCGVVLGSLMAEISAVRHVSLRMGMIPANGLMGHQCSVSMSNLPARDVLASILDQMGTFVGNPSSKVLYTWSLVHDPNWNCYFLNARVVPDLTPKPASTAARPVKPPTGTTAPTGAWWQVPAAKKP